MSAGVLLGALVLMGCTNPQAKAPKGSDAEMGATASKGADAEAEVRQAFAAFQTAVEKKSGEKMYDLLDEDSRQSADYKAKRLKEMFSKADEKKKKELEDKLKLSAAKLQDLDGKTFLESTLFYNYGDTNELPEVKKLDKVEVKGEKARVEFKDPDDPSKTEEVKLVRQNSRWLLQRESARLPE
jgi:hypothetical protein